RHGAHRVLVQMGPFDLHPAQARAAERSTARGGGHTGAGRPDLGTRICAFQAAVRERREDRPVERYLARPHAGPAEPRSSGHDGKGGRRMRRARSSPASAPKSPMLRPADAAAALIQLPDGRYLLQLRDARPDIFYPDHWGCFGGAIDPGETPESAL